MGWTEWASTTSVVKPCPRALSLTRAETGQDDGGGQAEPEKERQARPHEGAAVPRPGQEQAHEHRLGHDLDAVVVTAMPTNDARPPPTSRLLPRAARPRPRITKGAQARACAYT